MSICLSVLNAQDFFLCFLFESTSILVVTITVTIYTPELKHISWEAFIPLYSHPFSSGYQLVIKSCISSIFFLSLMQFPLYHAIFVLFHPSSYPPIFHFSGGQVAGAAALRGRRDLPLSPATSSSLSGGRPGRSQASREFLSWVYPWAPLGRLNSSPYL